MLIFSFRIQNSEDVIEVVEGIDKYISWIFTRKYTQIFLTNFSFNKKIINATSTILTTEGIEKYVIESLNKLLPKCKHTHSLENILYRKTNWPNDRFLKL